MKKYNVNYHRAKNWYLLSKRSGSIFGSQWIGGALLVVFAVAAILLANLEATKEIYHAVLNADFGFDLNGHRFGMTIEEWINDGLMVVFFFVVGLEIKRELVAGQLSGFKKAALPVAAALGGMVVPALIYMSLNHGTPTEAGWGIPMATDIAFAIGVLSLVGKRVPVSLKIFLTALAIVDDLGAILVIAIFYTSTINFVMLGGALLLLALMFIMNKRRVPYMWMYLIPGVAVWYMLLNSGVHATIAGVLVAMTIPTLPRYSKKYFSYKIHYFLEEFKFRDRPGLEVLSNEKQGDALYKVRKISARTISPAQKLEHMLNPMVTFFIMPVFALANAGVGIISFSAAGDALLTTQGMGIILGLVIGKPIGITLFSYLAIKSRLAAMPQGAGWQSLASVACLGGIGFTMSIFIDTLAFHGTPYMDAGKIAILTASVLAAVVGTVVINFLPQKKGSC